MTPEKRLEYARSMVGRNNAEAIRELQQVIDEVAPGGQLKYEYERRILASAHYLMGLVCASDLDTSISHYQAALELVPGYDSAESGLRAALSAKEKKSKKRGLFRR